MMSLYDVTETAIENTVPKDRRNGARYGQSTCVCVCMSAGDHHQTDSPILALVEIVEKMFFGALEISRFFGH